MTATVEPPLTPHASVALSGVPETMLWTLHNRAREAMRTDGQLVDPDAIRIYRSIDYDYDRRFGAPDGSHALRARLYDRVLRRWMTDHPGHTVVELGAGLETQVLRCDDGRVRWLAVDVPEAMAVRQRFIRHPRSVLVADSALSTAWMEHLDPELPVFVSAQGLLMYFERPVAGALVAAILGRFRRATLVFDVVPRWFSRLTRLGLHKTRHYRAPMMPWGLDGHEVRRQLAHWCPDQPLIVRQVLPYGPTRGPLGWAFRWACTIAAGRHRMGQVVEVRRTSAR